MEITVNEELHKMKKKEEVTLLLTIFIIAGCGLIYELLIGSLSAYLEGDSVTHFSLTIGFFMFAMGIGSYISRFFKDENLLKNFIIVEIILGIMGSLSGIILFFSYVYISEYMQIMILITTILGTLVGLELPLLTRIFKKYGTLALTLSTVFSFDYVGGLFAAILFPFFFMPHFGSIKTGLIFGLLNLFVALITLNVFKNDIPSKKFSRIKFFSWSSIIFVVFLFIISDSIVNSLEASIYSDEVVFSKQTKYQKIIVTKWRNLIRVYINGNIQFSSADEYRYHESLVHPPMITAFKKENILILGGGDGLAAREILKYKEVKSIHLVDIDPAMTTLAKTNGDFKKLNNNSLSNPKLKIINEDARKFLSEWNKEPFDVIIIDFPDPDNETLSKLYSVEFYRAVKKQLAQSGVMVVQSTSPYYAKKAFYMIKRTIAKAGLFVKPYHSYVPSFGEWGYVMGSPKNIFPEKYVLPENIKFRFLNNKMVNSLFNFPEDMKEDPHFEEINHITSGNLFRIYNKEWDKWN